MEKRSSKVKSENEQENTTTVPLNKGINGQQTRQQRIM